jgi:hypothetical protein
MEVTHDAKILTVMESSTDAHSDGHGEYTSTEGHENGGGFVVNGANPDRVRNTTKSEQNGRCNGLE